MHANRGIHDISEKKEMFHVTFNIPPAKPLQRFKLQSSLNYAVILENVVSENELYI